MYVCGEAGGSDEETETPGQYARFFLLCGPPQSPETPKGKIDLCRIFKLFFRLFKVLRISQNSYVDLFSLMAYTRCMNLKLEP